LDLQFFLSISCTCHFLWRTPDITPAKPPASADATCSVFPPRPSRQSTHWFYGFSAATAKSLLLPQTVTTCFHAASLLVLPLYLLDIAQTLVVGEATQSFPKATFNCEKHPPSLELKSRCTFYLSIMMTPSGTIGKPFKFSSGAAIPLLGFNFFFPRINSIKFSAYENRAWFLGNYLLETFFYERPVVSYCLSLNEASTNTSNFLYSPLVP
jgi:hypothetical protein